MGAWGAYEKGWPQLAPRYDWAAARFQPSGAKLSVEDLRNLQELEQLAHDKQLEPFPS